jgi:cytochrome b
MIVALLVLLIIVSVSGWLSQTDAYFGVPWVDHLHHILAHLLLGLIGLHVAGVIISSWLHRENLVLAMITGHKPVKSGVGAEFE